MVKYRSDPLSEVYGALADPTRRAILARLALGETSVGELAEPFEMSLPAVSKHLGVLETAGLVQRQSPGRVRRCQLDGRPRAAPPTVARPAQRCVGHARAECPRKTHQAPQ